MCIVVLRAEGKTPTTGAYLAACAVQMVAIVGIMKFGENRNQ